MRKLVWYLDLGKIIGTFPVTEQKNIHYCINVSSIYFLIQLVPGALAQENIFTGFSFQPLTIRVTK